VIRILIDQSQPGPGEGVRAFFVTPAGVAPPPPPILPPAAGPVSYGGARRRLASPWKFIARTRSPRDRDGGRTGLRCRGRRVPGGLGGGIIAGVPAEEPPRRWFTSAMASSRPGSREQRRARGSWALHSRWLLR
jgi:hypothetical protein